MRSSRDGGSLMSDRMRPRGCAALLMLAVLPGWGAAQQGSRGVPDRSALEAHYRARIAAARVLVAANDSAVRAASARRVLTYATPVTRGPITILTSPEMGATAAEILRRADSIANQSPYGIPADLHVAYRLMPLAPLSPLDTVVRWRFVNPADAAKGYFSVYSDSVDIARASHSLAEVATAHAAARLPTSMQRWLGARLLDRDYDHRWETVYSIMVTSPAFVTRTCLSGHMAACRQVLRIERPADPLLEWYTPAARRALVEPLSRPEVRTLQRVNVDANMPGGLTACVQGRDDTACTRILRTYYDSSAWLRPAGTDVLEEALVQAAVAMPGAPGISAVLGKESLNLARALESIGGQPLDRVIEAWLARVKAARIESVELAVPQAATATAWLLLFGVLALGGTRWRSA